MPDRVQRSWAQARLLTTAWESETEKIKCPLFLAHGSQGLGRALGGRRRGAEAGTRQWDTGLAL